MRRLLREAAAHEQLARTGWARLPPLEGAALDRLRALADEATSSFVRHPLSNDGGFDELWGNADEARRREIQARLGAALTPFLEGCCENHRAVLFNVMVKRARAPESSVRFHQDFAFLDERRGEVALQLWIPLVPVSPGNGGLVVVEGTHVDASWFRPHDVRHPLFTRSLTELPPNAVQPVSRAGEGVVFTNRTVHGSPPNLSGADRPAIGCVLIPRDAPLVHWVRRGPELAELWAIDDADIQSLRPGQVPPGAKLVETVAPPAESR